MDKFCVGDEVYYEFLMIIEGLLKFYFVKQLRINLNNIYYIERIIGQYFGVSISFIFIFREYIK